MYKKATYKNVEEMWLGLPIDWFQLRTTDNVDLNPLT